MKKTCISPNWLLTVNGHTCRVDLPNDYAITMPRRPDAAGGASNGFFDTATGVYAKYIDIPAEKKHLILDVDGAYMCATVILNEYQLLHHPHGYTPALVDLTDRVLWGETNRLQIRTRALQCSTRWYSGAGVYRDVFLWEGGDIRIEPWDKFITTPTLDAVCAEYQVSADRDACITLTAEVLDADGRCAAAGKTELRVTAGQKTKAALSIALPDAHPWSPDSPYLYTLRTTLTEGSTLLDEDETTFGVRTISCNAKTGLLLNGQPIKLRGGCIHHDHGALGAAAFPAAETRKLSLLKAAGFNALRIAHNPPSLALLEAADRLGILIMDEAFDIWQSEKAGPFAYHLWFADWWERDIAWMVLRERNHPSVISYSIGNEIPESCGSSNGAELARQLAAEIRKYDATRLVTSATWGLPANVDASVPESYRESFQRRIGGVSWEERTAPYYAPLDICGYNYLYRHYEDNHELFPDRVIWGSETHALTFYDSWASVMRNPYVLGDFTWTAFDNLGEAGTGRSLWARDGEIHGISLAAYPWRSCYQGDFDLCGYRRPQSYFREAIWKGNGAVKIFTTHPEHYGEGFTGTAWHWYDVLDSWTFDDAYLGRPVRCEVYTTADEVEWILNGKVLGRTSPEKAIAFMDIPYERGMLEAVSYRGGAECGHAVLETVGEACGVSVRPERNAFTADGRDLCYFAIDVTDASGQRVPHAQCELSCLVDGGELLGIFSGDPKNEDQYGSNTCHAFEGRAMAIVRAYEAGEVSITVGGPGLKSASASVAAK